ncbi:thiamine-phosphate pyrophosphorylase [Sulfuricurvum sp. RIFCSPLOWO2_12_FULL_43_24]|uniref:thiamine-phosphate pyrophosphorylase n=1 Tax=Sulfuricurvum sp. RIFCSPLOWO2_12_FULL_43_24 TaxID=1802247 RepID=UPI0008CAB3F6|nr:thiamine-phosphate pyrophosphorylase [Sulfuricurvum sp. RIFCSPLOWO2_12_FULL_43_24]OHD84872.1 MAG: thiamine-phosphate pyrophosphorylase [Sulfuricurvum sp. RIFCSPHIGHO2_02_FULL_43_9]OHD86096.1 MAG: thiamine-phosphate pyrophosphorylase [Sulfuricurvum sp. RIFCSPLOWO2_02_FULL_43_45]OHD87175.1 MAG: thiamine-phosphate pyrophosphorylase [Sulfuricurvum sp. RIFCSPLOWO2_12_43_5]OHD87704.1 MAG: thiamine-phosphate pyrophosphorylase [Sulfuricurvum sp. RIFCSPLOWO2_02_43_6]OHD89573.1 MAG: thiamine-phosphat
MTNNQLPPELLRVVDANTNRLKEGIRVIEDIARYVHNDKELSTSLKNLRHQCRIEPLEALLASRDSVNDVLRPTMQSEMNRTDLRSILIANYKRAQESSRVLEELYKIVEPALSERFKNIRYELYTLEKKNLLDHSNGSR